MKDFSEFAAGPLTLPIGGRDFIVPPIGAIAGLRLIADDDDEMTSEEVARLLLGTAYDDMVEADVPAVALARAILTATVDFKLGREIAELVWESGNIPEAIAAFTAATLISTSTPESLTESATETPLPASSSGTTSPKTSGKSTARAKSRRSSPGVES